MRKAFSPARRPPLGARWELGATLVSAAIAYGLLVLVVAMTVERLIQAAPPEIVAGLMQSAVAGGLAP
jgi:hypothetical protein